MPTGSFAAVNKNPMQVQPRTSPLRDVYDAAATTQAEDYDNIMGNYDDILSNSRQRQNSGLNYVPINPVFSQNLRPTEYNRSGDFDSAISGLSEFGRTGGYSQADIGNIRERSISPIRSIYDTASKNIARQKVLSGGYSPNQGALQAKLARESSSKIGDITTKVNADIAQMVAEGKMRGLTSYGNLAGQENNLINATNRSNTEMFNENELNNVNEARRVNTINSTGQNTANNRTTDDQLNAVQGQASLYGTTPALTRTFADQVLNNNAQNMQAVTTANNLKNQRANVGLNLVNNQLGGRTLGANRG